jgi:hypothetical protein
LPTVCEKGFGAKTLRALAVEAFGSDPKEGYTRKHNKSKSVQVPLTLYALFQERSPITKTAVFIRVVLEDWLNTATTEQQSRVAAALLTLEESNHQRRRAERNRVKAEKLAAKEAKAAARKAEIEAFREAERVKRDAERERKRVERERVSAERDAARERAEERARIAKLMAKIVKGIEQSMYGSCFKATKFKSLAVAAAAAEKYTTAKGYDFEGFLCEKCSRYHIRADEVKFEAKRRACTRATTGLRDAESATEDGMESRNEGV